MFNSGESVRGGTAGQQMAHKVNVAPSSQQALLRQTVRLRASGGFFEKYRWMPRMIASASCSW